MSLALVRDLCREAQICADTGRIQEGRRLAAEAVATSRAHLGEAHYAHALSLCSLGWLEYLHGDVAAADALYERAEPLAQSLVTDDYEHARVVLEHAAAYWQARGAGRRALALERELVRFARECLGSDHPRYLTACVRLAALEAAQRESNAAP